VVEFTGLPQSPDKITASAIEACHVLLVGERDERGVCAASRALVSKSQTGGVAGALRRASSGRSSLAWKPVRHYYSHKCSCLEPHAGRRADVAVHYRIEVSSTSSGLHTHAFFKTPAHPGRRPGRALAWASMQALNAPSPSVLRVNQPKVMTGSVSSPSFLSASWWRTRTLAGHM
jgi:hypothetical protein